jgi:hypothetical protein
MAAMGDLRPQESIFGYSGPVARGLAACILMAAITAALVSLPEQSAIPFEELRGIARDNRTSLLLGPGPAAPLAETATTPSLDPSARA